MYLNKKQILTIDGLNKEKKELKEIFVKNYSLDNFNSDEKILKFRSKPM